MGKELSFAQPPLAPLVPSVESPHAAEGAVALFDSAIGTTGTKAAAAAAAVTMAKEACSGSRDANTVPADEAACACACGCCKSSAAPSCVAATALEARELATRSVGAQARAEGADKGRAVGDDAAVGRVRCGGYRQQKSSSDRAWRRRFVEVVQSGGHGSSTEQEKESVGSPDGEEERVREVMGYSGGSGMRAALRGCGGACGPAAEGTHCVLQTPPMTSCLV